MDHAVRTDHIKIHYTIYTLNFIYKEMILLKNICLKYRRDCLRKSAKISQKQLLMLQLKFMFLQKISIKLLEKPSF